jgi:hypothetical protein
MNQHLSMMGVIRAGASNRVFMKQSDTLYYDYPQTRKDAALSDALIHAVLCGADITNIDGERGPKIVTADEVLVCDPYRTGYETEIV